MEVKFHGNRTYAYKEVPEKIHTELKEAKSIGKYFNANVRDKFDFEKITL